MVVLVWIGMDLPEPRLMVQRWVAELRTPIGMSLFFVCGRISVGVRITLCPASTNVPRDTRGF